MHILAENRAGVPWQPRRSAAGVISLRAPQILGDGQTSLSGGLFGVARRIGLRVALGAKLDGQRFVVIRSASDAGALYGSVTARDAADAATAGGFTVNRGQVVLDRPIKDLGLHAVTVTLHPEVVVKIQLNVARSVEEAELQASGKSIQELAAEAEAAADFEIAELFDEMGAAAGDEDLSR